MVRWPTRCKKMYLLHPINANLRVNFTCRNFGRLIKTTSITEFRYCQRWLYKTIYIKKNHMKLDWVRENLIFYLTVSFYRHIPRLIILPVSYMESFLCNNEGINKIIRSRYVTISKDIGYSLTPPFTSDLYSVTHVATLGLHFKHAAGIKLLKYCRYDV